MAKPVPKPIVDTIVRALYGQFHTAISLANSAADRGNVEVARWYLSQAKKYKRALDFVAPQKGVMSELNTIGDKRAHEQQ